MNKHISEFIKKLGTANICCVDADNHPYCFSCYYTYDANKHLLYYKSSAGTHHGILLQEKPLIAGTILPEKQEVMNIKGIQFTGLVLDRKHVLATDATRLYHIQYPFALAMPGDIYTIRLDKIKMTDNSLGFGKKISWDREEEHRATPYQQSYL
jgi:uncharacterized protein